MSSGFHHASLVDDMNDACALNGRQSVRDDNGCTVLHEISQGGLNCLLCLAVERRGWLVQEMR